MSPTTTVTAEAMSPGKQSRGTRTSRAVALLLLVGALAYTTWVFEAFLPTGISPLRSYVSELAGEDQPYGTFFRTADLFGGLFVLAGAVVALVRPPRGALAVTGWAGLVLFGAATVADSRLPLSCAPTADAGCAARERAGDIPWTHAAHAFSSSSAVVGALIGMVLLTVVARRHADSWPLLARTGPVLVVVELAATGWTLAAVAAFDAGHGTWGLGVAQRIQLLSIAVWIAALAWSVLSSAADPAERRG
ncbi:DUF998 domain-containing protein [Streptomyces sp. NPDC059002]|uniref:DUF998 domain-containing protein n=1 Tax=Streptomyces sp. NPDC059002 TaxID=3346690 RepID=UPI0036B6A995